MKLLFDFLPIVLFFVAYKLGNIYIATGAAMAVSVLLIGWLYLKKEKPSVMQWVSVGMILVFGGASIYFQDPKFFQWKFSIVYMIMALALLGTQLIFKRNFLKTMMGKEIALPEAIWMRLTWMWSGFFFFMAVLNLYIMYAFSIDTWTNFKMFGSIGLLIAFIIAQSVYLSRYIQEDSTAPKAPQESAK